jgi:hypothetical protein
MESPTTIRPSTKGWVRRFRSAPGPEAAATATGAEIVAGAAPAGATVAVEGGAVAAVAEAASAAAAGAAAVAGAAAAAAATEPSTQVVAGKGAREGALSIPPPPI